MLFRLLVDHLRPYRGRLGALVALQTVSTLASLYVPSLNADIIDVGIATGDSGYIVRTGGVMLLVTLVQVLAAAGAVYYGARVAMAVGRDVRAAVFARVQTLSAREVARFGAASLVNRTTNDVQQIQLLLVMVSTMFVTAPITCVLGVAMALREDVGLSWLLAVCVPVLAVSVGLVIVRMVPRYRWMQERLDTVNEVLREQLSGMRVIRAFAREPAEVERFATANRSLTDTALRVGRLQALIYPTVMLVLNGSSVAVLWFGALRIDAGEMRIGSLIAFLSYLMQILIAVMMATFVSTAIPRAAVCAGRITDVLATEPELAAPPGPVRATGPPVVEFRDVEVRHPGAAAPVLSGVTFRAVPGSVTAIVGSTGAGKTTLLSLVPRLLDVSGGTVLVAGTDVRDQDPDALCARIGLVPQHSYLFGGTVASNLRHADPDADDDALWEALDIAQAREFVEATAGGLDAPVEPGGTNLSGGQRQRLAIARALVRRAGVYLFDDSFSALDPVTDAAVRAGLRRRTADATVLMTAQRIATIRDADRIVVLENGSPTGIGTHDELLAGCPAYVEIVESQPTADLV